MDRVLIVGVGNPDCGDDALGQVVAGRLSALDLCGAKVCSLSGNILSLIEDWRAAEAVILIDAAAPERTLEPAGPAPIHRIDVGRQSLPRDRTGHSTHGFGLAETVELARALGALPARTIVYAVEGRCFCAGAPLSPAVEAALDELTNRIRAEVESLLRNSGQESSNLSSSDRK
jgi:hydrogenase maturation protease